MGAQRRRDEMESRFKFQHFIFGLLGGAWAGGTRAVVPAGRLMKRGWGGAVSSGPRNETIAVHVPGTLCHEAAVPKYPTSKRRRLAARPWRVKNTH